MYLIFMNINFSTFLISKKKYCLLTSFIAAVRNNASKNVFTGEYSCRSLFFNKVKGSELATLLQKDFFDTGVLLCWRTPFLQNNFQEQSPGCVLLKKVFLKASKNWQKNTRHEGLQLYWKEPPAQEFSSEFCKIFSNACFVEHLLTTTTFDFRLFYYPG